MGETNVTAFGSAPTTRHGPCEQDIFGEDICETPIHARADVVEFGDERMFEPIDNHLRDDHKYHRLLRDAVSANQVIQGEQEDHEPKGWHPVVISRE